MHTPEISIVMATFDNGTYLKKCIESVLKQEYTDWEFIIINDASIDNTESIIKRYLDERVNIVYIKNTRNLGLIDNLNRGLDIAKGKYIARIDGDDYWSDNSKLQKQVDFLNKNPQYGIVGCLGYAVDEEDNKLYEVIYPSNDKDLRNVFLKHNCFLHSGVVMKKSIVNKVHSYNPKYPFAQDYDLFLKIGTISKLHILPKFMIGYRINPRGHSQTKYQKQILETLEIIHAYKNNYPRYLEGYIMWNLRKLYPAWFRGALAREIKKKIPFLHFLSGA